ncbi:toxin CrTX-A-like [Mizuhopecten yessoensis]|uniref:Toxin CaTX-A n=1 Tax=Mizuhopecten yessoensis TaxID=6573 RepID=A0A210Q2R8_MIZYE|nr:toxin CrTX-A-like [Mizuhopecten yessoensis]OWF43048.1 Toxin CaTX-A [Mizuhopecten yessoensis]
MTEKAAVLEKLKQIGKSVGKENVTDGLAQILVNESVNGGNLQTVLIQIGRIGLGVKDMFDPNYAKKLTGLISVLSAIRELVPIFGPPAREFAKCITSILVSSDRDTPSGNVRGPDGFKGTNTVGMLAKVISDALDAHEDAIIKTNADSTCRVFAFAHNVLIGVNSDSENRPNRSEISDLIHLIDINAGVKALGKLESRILVLMENDLETLSEEALSTHSRRIIQYIDMYCHLAILRDAVMLELYAMLRYSGHSDRLAEGIRTGLEGEHERDRNLVKSLVLPNQTQVRFASFFDPDHWPFTCKFMEDCTNFHAPENLDKVPVAMNTMKWMNWFATHDTKPAVCLRASKSPSERSLNKTKHNFVLLKKADSTCYYISPQGQKDMYVVMRGGDKKWVEVRPGRPGKEGEWNIFNVEDKDAVYMLSTRRWPVHFMSMSDTWFGWIQGRTVSVSDPSAHWVIQYNGSKA